MKKLLSTILLLSLSVPAYADDDGCYYKTVKVCPLKHKAKPKPAPVVVLPVESPACPPVLAPIVVEKVKTVEKKVFVPVKACPICPPEGPVVVGGHAALGLGVRDPYVSGMLGLRLRFPQAWLGLEVFSALQYGVGFQGLVYVYQGPVVKVHVIDPGVLVTGSPFSYLGEKDVHRRVDLLLGAGVEVKLMCHLALTADWRVGIPDPRYLAEHQTCDGSCPRHVNPGNTVGNAFATNQLFLGLLVHN